MIFIIKIIIINHRNYWLYILNYLYNFHGYILLEMMSNRIRNSRPSSISGFHKIISRVCDGIGKALLKFNQHFDPTYVIIQ